jgi:hypothetical protein
MRDGTLVAFPTPFRLFPTFPKQVMKWGRARRMHPHLLHRTLQTIRISHHFLQALHRQRIAKQFLASRPVESPVSPVRGFQFVAPQALPQVAEVVALCQGILQRWKTAGSQPTLAGKANLQHILSSQDLAEYPLLFEFVLSDIFLRHAMTYLRTVPRLQNVSLLWTPVHGDTQSSQMFHLDGIDHHQFKCVINLTDVDEASGPFSFLPADLSKIVMKRERYTYNQRLSDDIVFRHVKPDQVQRLLGPAGSCALLDTCRCLHFGARARQRERLVLIFNFTHPYSPFLSTAPITHVPTGYEPDAIRRMVLGLPT